MLFFTNFFIAEMTGIHRYQNRRSSSVGQTETKPKAQPNKDLKS